MSVRTAWQIGIEARGDRAQEVPATAGNQEAILGADHEAIGILLDDLVGLRNERIGGSPCRIRMAGRVMEPDQLLRSGCIGEPDSGLGRGMPPAPARSLLGLVEHHIVDERRESLAQGDNRGVMHSRPVLDFGYDGGRAGARIETLPGRARGGIDAWARMRSGPMLSVLPAWKPWTMKRAGICSGVSGNSGGASKASRAASADAPPGLPHQTWISQPC